MKTKTTRRRQAMTLRTRFSVQRVADAADRGNAIPYLHIYYITAAAFCQAFKQGFRFFILNFGIFFMEGGVFFARNAKSRGGVCCTQWRLKPPPSPGYTPTRTRMYVYMRTRIYTHAYAYTQAHFDFRKHVRIPVFSFFHHVNV